MIAKKEENIITIEFEEYMRIVAPALFQHNTGQVIKFNDVPDGAEVQFSNENSEKTTNKIVKDSQILIPDFLVAEGLEITAYIQYVSETSETTVKIISIPVEARVKQGEVVAPENEQTFREELQGIMNETKEAAKEAADKVEVNRKYLDEMDKKSTDTIENITTVGEAQINVINDTAVSQIKAINGTAQAQIESINNVATKNIEAETNSIVQAAQGQIVGINQVASGQIDAINDTANRQIYGLNQTATSQIKAINDTAQAQSKALQEQGDGLKYDLAVKEKHTIMLSAGAYSDLIDVNEYDAIQVNSISCNGTDTISESLKLEVVKFKNGEQVGDEFLEKYNAIADLTDCDSIKLLVAYQGGISDVATVWYTLIVWDAKKEIERYVERVEDAVLIKPTASGTDIVIDDSSDMSIQELHLYGKMEQKTTKGIQLLNLLNSKGGTGDGVTYTPNGDGSFKKTGTATGQIGNIWLKGGYYSDWEKRTPIITLEVGKSYYIKDCLIFQGVTNIAPNGKVINVTEEQYPEGIKITGIRNTGFTLNKTYNEVIYPIIAESSTAVDWEEYTGGQPSPSLDYPQEINCIENPTVSVVGKNLFDVYGDGKNKTVNGVTFNWNDDNSITIKGTATGGIGHYVLINFSQSETRFNNSTIGMNYTLKVFGLPESCYLNISYGQKTYGENTYVMKNVAEYSKRRWTAITVPEGVTVDATVYPMLVLGDTINEYEPYKQIQTVTFNHSLNGIDDVKDELIIRADGTGQLIQRLLEEELNDNSNYATWYKNTNTYGFLTKEPKWLFRANKINIKSNKLKGITNEVGNSGTYYENGILVGPRGYIYFKILKKYLAEYTVDALKTYLKDNPITVVGILKEPIVTDLTAEEVQKVLALHTNKPNTTIWNDQNADMEVTYVADAKSYIDNKLAEIQALTLEGGN